jgi:DNA transformation protein and related proteins
MSAFVDALLDLLIPLGEVTARRMFGGHGIYKDGAMFGLVAGDRFYIKSDDANNEAFIARGCEPFVFGVRNGKPIVSKYYEPPESAFINAQKMKPWATLGIEASRRAPATKKKPRNTKHISQGDSGRKPSARGRPSR